MPEERVARKELWKSLGNTKKKDWIKAADKLGLRVTQPKKRGTSHYAIRKNDPEISDDDIRGLIALVYDGMNKKVNEKVFKKFLNHGIPEDDIWKSLDKL